MSVALTSDDYYEITVEPISRIVTVIFQGPHWCLDVCEYIFNENAARIINNYAGYWLWFKDRDESMTVIKENRHQFSWCWEKREANIKGDG